MNPEDKYDGEDTCTGQSGEGAASVGVSNVGVSNVGVSNVGVSNVGVSNVGVSNVGVSNVGVSNVGVSNVGVSNVGALHEDDDRLREAVITALKQCYDPEIPVNIYDLGLIYDVDVFPLGVVNIRMTLTSPACPVAESLPPEVEQRVKQVDGVSNASVEVVWDPPWHKDLMTEAAKLELNLL